MPLSLYSILSTSLISSIYGVGIDAAAQKLEVYYDRKKVAQKRQTRKSLSKSQGKPTEDDAMDRYKDKTYDWQRSLRYGTVALVWVGPWMNIRFCLIDWLTHQNGARAGLL